MNGTPSGERVWLVLDDVLQIRFQVEYTLAVRRDTHESLMMYRVNRWVLKREERWPLGYYEELSSAGNVKAGGPRQPGAR